MAALVAGVAVVLLALWLRDPLIPYAGDTPRASELSADSARLEDSARRSVQALSAMRDAIQTTHSRLAEIAASALDAPASSENAFTFLRKLPDAPDQGVLLVEGGEPAAWAGQIKALPMATGTGTSVSVGEFYVTLQVVMERGARRSIATSVIHAAPPADGIASDLASRVAERVLVQSFRFSAPEDAAAGIVVASRAGHPLVSVDAIPLSGESVRFASAARLRGRGVALLGLLTFFLIALGWSDRRKVGKRLFTLVVAGIAVALIPWNNFSNFSRAFDPAYFYSPLLGPFTAGSGAYLMFASLVLLAVVAVIRARVVRLPPAIAAVTSLALVAVGFLAARSTSGGISLPLWGATARLWLQWQLPIFLLLFACWLAAAWLAMMAMQRRPTVQLRTAALIAVAAGALSTFFVWNVTTEQRLQLAMRDVAGLDRTDPDASFLLARFGQDLVLNDSAGSRADLLKRFAASDLAAAAVQVSLSLWNTDGSRYGALDLAPLQYDTAELARAVAAADDQPGVTESMGPAGRLLTLVVPHRAGGFTTVVASPRTRLVAQDPYAALLGFAQPEQTDAPYVVTLADVTPRTIARAGVMTWRRIGSEWHGDQLITTSRGPARAHVEIDIRSWGTRMVRASLAIVVDLILAGILWSLGAMAEGGFFRWVRGRAARWAKSYRGRLTLALFMFFVVPAVAFAAWSYQRLRGDDRSVRELLVLEDLEAAAGGAAESPGTGFQRGKAPLFVYSRSTLVGSSDSLFEQLAPAGRMLPRPVQVEIEDEEELTASWQQTISRSRIFWGYRAVSTPPGPGLVLAAPARSDEMLLDRRRRDLTMLVLFATVVGGLAALWLSGIAARVLARDLELAKIEVARAERVLAWGEMARQVAHEIKNPLTPIRLGVQHLRRARSDSRIDFDRVLDDNVTRILAEIDRLDEIARAFSRYGSTRSDLPPAEAVDIAAILRDVVGLEKMGIGGVTWSLAGADEPLVAQARTDELRDVLLNVFENARLARARNVDVQLSRRENHAVIEVTDDGAGIATAALPRVFEPHFSTRTTGSGLGLAISRRLLESWGGTIDLTSEEGSGARVVITLEVPRP